MHRNFLPMANVIPGQTKLYDSICRGYFQIKWIPHVWRSNYKRIVLMTKLMTYVSPGAEMPTRRNV